MKFTLHKVLSFLSKLGREFQGQYIFQSLYNAVCMCPIHIHMLLRFWYGPWATYILAQFSNALLSFLGVFMHASLGSKPCTFIGSYSESVIPISSSFSWSSPQHCGDFPSAMRGSFSHSSGQKHGIQSFSSPQCCAGPCHLGCIWDEVTRERDVQIMRFSPYSSHNWELFALFHYSER